MEIRPLQETDRRADFTSGDPDLDRYFQRYAGQNQFKHHIGTTYVAVKGQDILGFATVSPGHIEAEQLPDSLARRFPRYPLPILRLARMAVARGHQGQGIGGALLGAVFQLAVNQSKAVGCMGVVVDAKPQANSWYQQFGIEPLPLLEGQSRTRPKPTSMLLTVAEIQASLGDA